MCKTRFFICNTCGNLAGLILAKGGTLACCGTDMAELTANTVEASKEKHLPSVTVSGDEVKVKVGSEAHPMTEEHYIPFVYLLTESGGQRKCLEPGAAPEAVFLVSGDKPVAVYGYCNLHGLWRTDI